MITIRQASVTDAQFIIDFQLFMAKETENLDLVPRIVTKGVEAVFQDLNKGIYFVAEFENKVVASLMITYEWSDWRNGNVWWIQSVYVLPEVRRMGIFRQMYSYLKNIVEKDVNLRGLRLYVDKTNTKAQKVYQEMGMNGEHYQLFEWMK